MPLAFYGIIPKTRLFLADIVSTNNEQEIMYINGTNLQTVSPPALGHLHETRLQFLPSTTNSWNDQKQLRAFSFREQEVTSKLKDCAKPYDVKQSKKRRRKPAWSSQKTSRMGAERAPAVPDVRGSGRNRPVPP